eukprot:GHVS01101745.1.p1 GENE.GHVS01101745.1~~GHVS01101745.1.p1  ORF type:complete len:115 (+),score=8.31 GHVS01101745.1:430-774(+)
MSWSDEVKTQLQKLFAKYASETLSYIKVHCRRPVPIVDISLVSSVCHMLEGLLGPDVSGPWSQLGHHPIRKQRSLFLRSQKLQMRRFEKKKNKESVGRPMSGMPSFDMCGIVLV